jgi:hypothetical protein
MPRKKSTKFDRYIARVTPQNISSHTIWGIGKTEEETEKDTYYSMRSCIGGIRANACTRGVLEVVEKYGIDKALRNCCVNDDDCIEVIPSHVAIEEICAKYSLPDEAYYQIVAVSLFRNSLDGEDIMYPIYGYGEALDYEKTFKKRNLDSQLSESKVSNTQDIPSTENLTSVFQCKYGSIEIDGYVGIADARGHKETIRGIGQTEEEACINAVKDMRATGEILIYPCSKSVIRFVKEKGGENTLDYCLYIDNDKSKFLMILQTDKEIAAFQKKYSLTTEDINELLRTRYIFHQRWRKQ